MKLQASLVMNNFWWNWSISKRYIWKAEWIKSSALRESQAPSSPDRQNNPIHSKAQDVGQVTWSRKYKFLWKFEYICWNQWFWSHHSDSMSQGVHLFPERILWIVLLKQQCSSWLGEGSADFSCTEEDQFIEITCDSTVRLRFTAQTLSGFWLGVERDHILIRQRAVVILLLFATSLLCEVGLFCCGLTEDNVQI